MKYRFLPALSLLALTGCLAPVTDRLDATNRQLLITNEQLVEINRKLDESNRRLDVLEKRMPRIPGLAPSADATPSLPGTTQLED